MCEARVVLKTEEGETTVMEEAAAVVREDGKWVVRSILGQREEVEGELQVVDLVQNIIVLSG